MEDKDNHHHLHRLAKLAKAPKRVTLDKLNNVIMEIKQKQTYPSDTEIKKGITNM